MYPELVAQLWSRCQVVTCMESLIGHVELNSGALWFVRCCLGNRGQRESGLEDIECG